MKNINKRLKISKFVSLTKHKKSYFCISHSLTQQQIFGDNRLKKIFNILSEGINYGDFYSLLNKFFNKKEVKDLLVFFKKEKFLQEKDKNTFNQILHPKNLNKDGYRLLRILLTDICNLNCKYCKVMSNIKTPDNKSTSKNDLEKVIKLFLKGSKIDCPKIIHITGGEPLVFWNKIKYLVSLVNKNRRLKEKLMIVIGTNGLLINQEKANFIKKNKIKVIVSLDGSKKIHNKLRKLHNNRGSYSYVDKALLLLKKSKIDLGISMVIGKHNNQILDQEINYIINRYNPISLGINYMKPPTRKQINFPYLITPKEYVDAVYSAYKKYRNTGLYFELIYRKIVPFVEQKFRYYDCGATAGTTINLDFNGKIGPCKSFLILDMLAEKSKSKKNKKYINQSALTKRSPIYIDRCRDCEAIGICGNGCAYEAWVNNNNFMSIDKNACCYTKLFFKMFIEDLFDIIENKLTKKAFYTPKKQDRKKLYGKIKINKLNLNSSIGHEGRFI